MIKLLGITDERTNCEKCGKSNLKKTIALDIDGAVVYYGSDCAAKLLYGEKSKKFKDKVELRAVIAQAALGNSDPYKAAAEIRAITGLNVDVRDGVVFVALGVVSKTVFLNGRMSTVKSPHWQPAA